MVAAMASLDRAAVLSVALGLGCSATAPPVTPITRCAFSARTEQPRTATELELAAAGRGKSSSPAPAARLARALDNAATDAIVRLLDHPSAQVVEAVVEYLLAERPHSWAAIVQRSTTRQDLSALVVDSLCRGLDRGGGGGLDGDQTAFLLDIARRRPPDELSGRALVCVAKGRASDARALALQWLDGSSPGLARYAVTALGRANALFEVERVVTLASAPELDTRIAAIDALGGITSAPAAAALLKMARESPDEALREHAWMVWSRHPERRAGTLSQSAARRALLPLVSAVLRALRQEQLEALVRLVHPERGLRFGLCGQWVPSPLYPAQIRGLLRDQSAKSWGGQCGEVSTELSFEDYLELLVGYEEAPVVGYNAWLRASSKDGQPPAAATERAFPEGVFVELAWPEGRDGQTPWESLVLVFEEFSERYRLVAILQAQAAPPPKQQGVRIPPPGELLPAQERR